MSSHEVVQIDRLSDDQRELLQSYLRGAAIPFELSPTTVSVESGHVDDLYSALTIVGNAKRPGENASASEASEGTDVRTDGLDAPAPRPLAWQPDALPGGRQVASHARRLLGALIDWVLVTAATLAADERDLWLIVIGIGAYTILATAFFGRTIGKIVVGTRVVRAGDFQQPGMSKAMVRWLIVSWGELLGLATGSVPLAIEATIFAVLVATYAPIVWDRRGRGWHDRFADTLVLR